MPAQGDGRSARRPAPWPDGALRAVPDAVLTTVLFTDIVGSTAAVVRLGDREWSEMLRRHDAAVRRRLVQFGGSEVDNAGDGFLASFAAPGQAIACALAIRDDLAQLGLQVRAGVHTGQFISTGDKLSGLAVHVGARIAATAAAGEVLVSATVRELVAGTGFGFVDRGSRRLDGLPGRYRLAAALRPGASVQHRRLPGGRVSVLLLIPMLAVAPAVSFAARALC